MKKSKAETAETRKRIVEIAAKAFRTQGIDATGVAEIMATAGLTHGGFYRHFASKDQLVAEAISATPKNMLVDTNAAAEEGAAAMEAVFRDYVTAEYRDDRGNGCPIAANGSELARADDEIRHRVTGSFRKIAENAAPFIQAQEGESQMDTTLSLFTNMIGALTVARMVDDPELSNRVLEVAQRRVARYFEQQPAKPKAATRKKAN